MYQECSMSVTKVADSPIFCDKTENKTQKGHFWLKTKKSEQHHWNLPIRISVATKFQLKLTILIFWVKFVQKGYFRSKTKKVNWIQKGHHWILYIPSRLAIEFHLKLPILFFWTKFPRKKISCWKQKKWTSPLNSAYSN